MKLKGPYWSKLQTLGTKNVKSKSENLENRFILAKTYGTSLIYKSNNEYQKRASPFGKIWVVVIERFKIVKEIEVLANSYIPKI